VESKKVPCTPEIMINLSSRSLTARR